MATTSQADNVLRFEGFDLSMADSETEEQDDNITCSTACTGINGPSSYSATSGPDTRRSNSMASTYCNETNVTAKHLVKKRARRKETGPCNRELKSKITRSHGLCSDCVSLLVRARFCSLICQGAARRIPEFVTVKKSKGLRGQTGRSTIPTEVTTAQDLEDEDGAIRFNWSKVHPDSETSDRLAVGNDDGKNAPKAEPSFTFPDGTVSGDNAWYGKDWSQPGGESDLGTVDDEENNDVQMFKPGSLASRTLTAPPLLQTGQARPSSVICYDHEPVDTDVEENGHTSDETCPFDDFLVEV